MTVDRPEPDLLTTREVAERLGESDRQVRMWLDRGLLPVAIRTGTRGRRWRWVRVADVEAFAAWDRVRTPRPPWLKRGES